MATTPIGCTGRLVTPSARLAALGLTLPPAPLPVGSYVQARVHCGMVFVTGQLPFVEGQILHAGLLGQDLDADQGALVARTCALNSLAAAAAAAGGLDAISGVLQVVGYLACAPGFTGHSAVLNGASDLLRDVLAPDGHTRTNIGVASLPLGSAVELQVTYLLVSANGSAGASPPARAT